MLKRFWLFSAQTITVLLALLFIVVTLKPQWLYQWIQFSRQLALPITASKRSSTAIDFHAANASYAAAAQKAMPAVVNVFTSKEGVKPNDPLMKHPLFQHFFGNSDENPLEPPVSNLGSGVIVSPEGYILTDEHVINGADEIEVALADGRKAPAKLIGVDAETDLAVLKINLTHLPSITFGQLEKARVGDVVLAIGNPFGIGQTVTMGIISALKRSNLGISAFENFIQTDASINPGNSGGALVDVHGNLLGINTAIYSRTGGSLGIGFAIPVSIARNVLKGIIANGAVTRGWIGIEPQDITPEIAESFALQQNVGTLVAGVWQAGPADKAGVRPGDIIVSVNGEKITDKAQLAEIIAQIEPGANAKLHIMRKRKFLDRTVKIAKRPPSEKEQWNNDEENE